MTQIKLTKAEACRRIGISITTLDRKAKEGKIKYIYGENTKFGKPSVHIPIESIGEYLGISDETELNKRLGIDVDKPVEPPAIAPQSPISHPKAMDDPTGYPYTEDYNLETYRDSYGHKILGNTHHKLFQTVRPEKSKPDPFTHMNPALLGTAKVENVNGGQVFDKGYSDAQYAEAMNDWNRSHGGPSMEQQRIAAEQRAETIRRNIDHKLELQYARANMQPTHEPKLSGDGKDIGHHTTSWRD